MSPAQAKATANFWSWFREHRSEFSALYSADEEFWDVALDQLKRINKHVWFELSDPGDTKREFIITVEGRAELFPLADAIVAKAPRLRDWKFISLKPAMGFDFTTKYENVRLDPQAMWFRALKNEASPSDLGLRIGVPGFRSSKKRPISNGVLVILDTALGERAAAVDIRYLETGPLPDEPKQEGWIPLVELANYIAWHKRNRPKLRRYPGQAD